MGVLDDVKVIDLSRVLAAPLAAQMLGDLGATVWKIEAPRGDDARVWGDHYFAAANRNKHGLAINLKEPEGQDIVRQLARKADVFIENFKPGDMARFGLDYASLAQENPRLVYLSLTGFGQTGPRRGQLGYDTVLQAMTGIMSVTGEPDRPPGKVGIAWIDVMSGLTATIALLAALRERDRSGRGQYIDLSLFDVGMMALAEAGHDWLLHGKVPMRAGSIHRSVAPSQPFEAADGWMIVAIGNDEQFGRMALALGKPEMASDPRYATNKLRLEHRETLAAEMAAIFKTKTRKEWVAAFEAAQAPLSPIFNVAEALADEQSDVRRAVWEVRDDDRTLKLLANPLQHMSRSPASVTRPPPRLDADTDTILTRVLGYSTECLARLRKEKVIGSSSVS